MLNISLLNYSEFTQYIKHIHYPDSFTSISWNKITVINYLPWQKVSNCQSSRIQTSLHFTVFVKTPSSRATYIYYIFYTAKQVRLEGLAESEAAWECWDLISWPSDRILESEVKMQSSWNGHVAKYFLVFPHIACTPSEILSEYH